MDEGEVGTPDVGRRVCAGVYRRQPEGSLLYRVVQENLATLREEAAEVGQGLPRYVAPLKDSELLLDVLTVFPRALFALQRRRARKQGTRDGQTGAVTALQYFGSALQVSLPRLLGTCPPWPPMTSGAGRG